MVYICRPTKVSIYVNKDKKTAAQIKAETGCTAIINGGLYDMNTFKPVCHLKVNNQVLANDGYKYFGFGWNNAELNLTVNYDQYENYICCVCLVRDGKAEKLIYSDSLGGNRARTAIGVFKDGRVWLYETTTGTSPEQLQQLALDADVEHAIMLDGGNSTQGIFPNCTISSNRIVHNYICVWDNSDNNTNTVGGDTMFKIALGAGHGINTPGKRCLKSLDPNETREWWLNDRVCDLVESYLKDYTGYSLIRLDDSDDGEVNVDLATRVKTANDWNADFYLSIHHNAGANGTSAGGIVAFTCNNCSSKSTEWRNSLYDCLIKYTGLKGNRSNPKATADYYVLKYSNMPAVLLELGFMDSKTDVPIILTNDYAEKCAKAIVEVLVDIGGLTKIQKQTLNNSLYKVQVGAFSNKTNAEKLQEELKSKGYQTYIVKT